MRLAPSLLALAAVAATASPARAGETACWFEQGVVIVPAEVLGVAGDFLLDMATPHSLLAETQAQGAGFTETSLRGRIRLAGLDLANREVAVTDLDLRTGALATPIAGVLGADILGDYVVDVSFAPCRIALRAPGAAPAFGRAARLPLDWVADTPVVEAGVSDGVHSMLGAFRLATAGDTAVRVNDAWGQTPEAGKPKELYPYGVLRPRLRALSLAGDLYQNLPGGLLKTEDPVLAGEIGTPILARYRLRFDFPAGRLWLAPARNEPAKPGSKPVALLRR